MAHFNRYFWVLGVLLSFFIAASAYGANYSFNNPPPNCTARGNTMTCPSGLTLQWNDTLSIVGSGRTLNITGNASLSNARINSGGNAATLTINISGDMSTEATAHINARLNIEGSLQLGSANIVNGDITAASIRVDASNSTINGALNSATRVDIGSGATIHGAISGTIITTTSSVALNGNITATQSFTLASGSSVVGNVSAPRVTISPSQSIVRGNVTAGESIEIGSGSGITGNAQAGDTILMLPANTYITGDARSPTISNNYGTIGGREICQRSIGATPVNCVADETPPPASQAVLPMCTDIWSADQRSGNRLFPTSDFSLPEEAINNPLPQTLRAGDYLRRGDFTLSTNFVTPEPSARVYVDGDLTIEQGTRINVSGNPENFILIVRGAVTIEHNVQVNGYIYANNQIYFAARTPFITGNASVTGGLVTDSSISSGNWHNPTINYSPPSRAIQGGNFCTGQLQQELWLQFSDSDWSPSLGSVADSSPIASDVINPNNGFSLPSTSLSVRAPNRPQYSSAGLGSALVADTNSGFLGTCSYADFTASEAHYFEAADTPRLNFNGSFSVGAWVYPESRASELMTVVSKDQNYEFHIRNNGRVNWWWHDAYGTIQEFDSEFTVPLNQWSYIGIRYTPTRQTIFMWDGANLRLSHNTSVSGLSTNNAPLQIGSDQNFAGRYFDGRIDEVRVIRGALMDAEIRALGQERASACGLQLQCTSDNFEDPNEFPLLWQTARSSGNFTPQVSNNRLRINQAVGDQATVAALRRAFPAANNYIEVSFDFYAYSGNHYDGSVGGDGIAIVFSDANEVPVPGSYGGSLGYAQRRGSGVDGPGFSGGWLGVGLDIYGNFSQATEGRIGGYNNGPASTRNRVALRGAEATGYAFIGMSERLSNMSSSASTRPSQPDSYRMSIDSRDSSQAVVTVERRAPGSESFERIFGPTDVFTLIGQQPAVPELLRLSITGSTGGAFSIHEIDNLEVCALQVHGLGTVLDHVRLRHSGSLVSCYSDSLEVLGCLNSDCSQEYGGAGNLTLQASQGQWRNTPHSNQNAQIPLVNGRGRADLSLIEGGEVNLTLLQTDPITVANRPLRCYQGPLGAANSGEVPCSILYQLAGIQFVDPQNVNTLDTRPVVAGVSSQRALRIVETNTQAESLVTACQARVANEEVPTHFGLECLNPAQCFADQQALVESASAQQAPVNILNDTALNLVFDSEGVARFNFNYSDVGQLRLTAAVDIDESNEQPAIQLQGSSAPFVSTPHSLQVNALDNDGQLRASANDAYRAAGEEFSVAIQSLNAHGEPTPNFGREYPLPTEVEANFVELIYPIDGEQGELNVSQFTLDNERAGTFISEGFTWSEVGTFTMRANLRDANYLGVATDSTLTRPVTSVGRFYPSHFIVDGSSIIDGCSSFTYMGQPEIGIDFTLLAVNTAGARTFNYGFGDSAGSANVMVTAVSANPADTADDNFASRLLVNSETNNNQIDANWQRGEMIFNTDVAAFTKRADRVPDGPYSALALGLQINHEADNRNFDIDELTLDTQSGPSAPLDGELNLRYGRLVIENTSGPESESLPVSIRAEFWDGNRFVVHQDDSCTELFAEQLRITNNPLNLQTQPYGGNTTLSDGVAPLASLVWQAPTTAPFLGEFEFEYQAPPWLQYPFAYDDNADDVDLNPRAFGEFGQYRGNDRVLYWLELR